MIKAVLIDVDDTLLDFKKCAHQSILSASYGQRLVAVA